MIIYSTLYFIKASKFLDFIIIFLSLFITIITHYLLLPLENVKKKKKIVLYLHKQFVVKSHFA